MVLETLSKPIYGRYTEAIRGRLKGDVQAQLFQFNVKYRLLPNPTIYSPTIIALYSQIQTLLSKR